MSTLQSSGIFQPADCGRQIGLRLRSFQQFHALRAVVDTQEVVEEEADYLVSGQGRRGTVRMIKSGEVSEVGAGK